MKTVTLFLLACLSGFGVGWFAKNNSSSDILNPFTQSEPIKEYPLAKYTFDNLARRQPVASKIEIGNVLVETEYYTSYVYYYRSEGGRISGLLTLPNLSRTMSAIVMARGYVDKEEYVTGVGTKNAAAYYAEHGYISLAPDFSGYGESDQEDIDPLAARLAKPVEILDLLASLNSLPQIDLAHVYLWGHSNGGQIMLSVAEIVGKASSDPLNSASYPTVRGATLWAPVSAPFPYSILYYTDEAEDQGKYLRGEIARFEADYDVYNYSIDRYLDWITIPIQIHQGSADDAVPKKWSDELVKKLKEKEKVVEYHEYSGADHNLRPAWDTVVARDSQWFGTL